MTCWVDEMQEWGRQGDTKLVKDPANKGHTFSYDGLGLLIAQWESSVELLHFLGLPVQQKKQAIAGRDQQQTMQI
jgi:YD repeat-containing protein